MDELLDMPSDVERGARVKVGHKYTLMSTCAKTQKNAKGEMYILTVFYLFSGLSGRVF